MFFCLVSSFPFCSLFSLHSLAFSSVKRHTPQAPQSHLVIQLSETSFYVHVQSLWRAIITKWTKRKVLLTSSCDTSPAAPYSCRVSGDTFFPMYMFQIITLSVPYTLFNLETFTFFYLLHKHCIKNQIYYILSTIFLIFYRYIR